MEPTTKPARASLEALLGLDGVWCGDRIADRPDVSILVLVMGATELLVRALDSIAGQAGTCVAEVLVLANGTGDEALRPVYDRNDVVVVRQPVNLGFSGGCNWAARFARGRHIVLLNDDAEVRPGWLDHLVSTAESSPSIGIVGSRILNPDASLQEAGSVLWRDGRVHAVGTGLPPGSEEFLFQRDTDYVSGCSLLIKRAVWEQLDGLDSRYAPAYFEDVDFCLRARQAGFRVAYEPRSQVTHRLGSSSADEFRHFLFGRNQRRFVERWAATLRSLEAEPTLPPVEPVLERAVHRARGYPRRAAAILCGGLTTQAVDGLARLAADHWAVTALLPGDPDGDVATRPGGDRWIEAGIDVRRVDPAGWLARPEIILDAVIVDEEAMHRHGAVLATEQPTVPIATLAEPVIDDGPAPAESVVHLRGVPVASWPEMVADAVRARNLRHAGC